MTDNLLIHTAVHAALMEAPERRIDDSLWVSDLGKNPYPALIRLLTGDLEPFDYATRLKMNGGDALEGMTLRQVAENLNRPIRTQFPLFNNIWSGYADLVIGHGTDRVIIYDHKGSAGRWWDYRESLPRASDCCQVWMYGELYHAMYDVKPELGLYYRGWGTWAEFRLELQQIEGRGKPIWTIVANGWITGEKGGEPHHNTRHRFINPDWLRLELESWYRHILEGEVTHPMDVKHLDPNGPDWDYAEDSYDRLAEAYG